MRKFSLLGVGCAALALGACTGGFDKVYSTDFWVEPGKYQFLKCQDIGGRIVAGSARERELMSLMERADQDPAGPLVNLMVYRSDLEQVRADLALLQRTSREKGCDNLVPNKK